MAIDLEQVHKLELVLTGVKEDDAFEQLTDWEQGFIASIEGRYEQYKDHILLSEKQWAVIERIYEIVCQ